MSASPQWSDSEQGDLLELVAMGTPSTDTATQEWSEFVTCLRWVGCSNAGLIRPNVLRPLLRGNIAPRRIGAFTNRALAQGLVEYTGEWQVSDDHAGRNGGKPARVMRWNGAA